VIVYFGGPFTIMVNQREWIIIAVGISIPSLRIVVDDTLARRIDAGEAALRKGIVSRPEVI
jgi:hypothetical protein